MIRHYDPCPEFIPGSLPCSGLDRFGNKVGDRRLLKPSNSTGVFIEQTVCRRERMSRRTVGAGSIGVFGLRTPQPPSHENVRAVLLEMRQTPSVFVQVHGLAGESPAPPHSCIGLRLRSAPPERLSHKK